MTALTPGTRVTVCPGHRCAYTGRVGVIGEIRPDQRAPYRVDGLADWGLWFTKDEIQASYEGEK